MSDEQSSQGGRVKAKNIKARNVVVGLQLQGEADTETVRAALQAMEKWQPGSVEAEETLETSGDIVTGAQIIKPEALDRPRFLQELAAIRQELAQAAQAEGMPAEARQAVEAVADTLTEAGQEKPRANRLKTYLKEAISYIGQVSETLDKAHQAGPLLLQAGLTLTNLLMAVPRLFGG